MGEITHKMAADNGINDLSNMSPKNSAGLGCEVYFPCDDVAPATVIEDVSANGYTVTTANHAAGANPYTIAWDVPAAAPTTGGPVSVSIGVEQAFTIFTMMDFSTDTLGPNFDHLALSFVVGSSGNGLYVKASSAGFAIEAGAVSELPFTFPTGDIGTDGYLVALVCKPRDSNGNRNLSIVAFSGSQTSGADRIVLASGDVACDNATITAANQMTVGSSLVPIYLVGAQSFADDLPDTIYDDLHKMHANALLGKKGLPANWVTLE